MSDPCPLCRGGCAGADLGPLLDSRLGWLWTQVAAAADRRGDPEMAAGELSLRAPESPEERAAAVGLVGGKVLRPGQTRRIDLGALAAKVKVRGPGLTPGAVAAHALARRLAARTEAAVARERVEHDLRAALARAISDGPDGEGAGFDPLRVWSALARNGWVARLAADPDPTQRLGAALVVIAALPPPGSRADRRMLASAKLGDPHGLDSGQPTAGLVLAILAAAGRVPPRLPPRGAWDQVGVDCDDLTGGLIALGLAPDGWKVPPGCPITLPPRTLGSCCWPSPESPPAWVFVTENPSIVSAAADLVPLPGAARLLCTSGTPSSREIEAMARLAHAGWRLAVRADFDEAGLHHVSALLAGIPGAMPWRMGASDYLRSLEAAGGDPPRLAPERLAATPWDPALRAAMSARGLAGFEEALLPALIEDLRRGTPPQFVSERDRS